MPVDSFKWHYRYIGLAREVATWSKDPSSKIGAVAVSSDGRILATGYNGFPRGLDDDPERYANRETKYSLVVHAEMNCIYNATYNGVSLNGSSMYVHGLPMCSECAKGVIQVGVSKVYWNADGVVGTKWSDSAGLATEILSEVGVEVIKV
jgi:dCMP deaminase